MKNFPIIAFLLLISFGLFAQDYAYWATLMPYGEDSYSTMFKLDSLPQKFKAEQAQKQVDAKLEAVKVNAGTFVNYSFEGDLCIDTRGNSIAITYYRQVGSITDSGDTILWTPEPITVRLPISENQQQFQLFASPGIIQAVSGFLKTQIDTTDFGQFKIIRK